MRRQNETVLKWLDSQGIHIRRQNTSTVTAARSDVRHSITAPVDRCLNGSQKREQEFFIKAGKWYTIQIVWANADDPRFKLDPIVYVQCRRRTMSTVRVRVENVWRSGTEVKLQIQGQDRFGNKLDGMYSYFLTPDLGASRDVYIASVTE